MNKKLVPVIIILLLLAGGGYYLKSKGSPAGVVGNQTDSQVMSEAAEFAKAIESGKPTVCTMAKDDDKMEYHIKGKLMRANITAKVGDKTTLSHMINDGAYLYMWSDDQKQGSKMSFSAPSPSPFDSTVSQKSTLPKFEGEDDYQSYKDQGYSINCKSGSIDESIFTPPSSVEFIDPSAMMKAIPSPDANGQYDMSKLEELQKQYGGTANPEE